MRRKKLAILDNHDDGDGDDDQKSRRKRRIRLGGKTFLRRDFNLPRTHPNRNWQPFQVEQRVTENTTGTKGRSNSDKATNTS